MDNDEVTTAPQNRESEEFKDDTVYARSPEAPVLETMNHEELKAYCIQLEKVNKEVVDAHNKLVDEAEETVSAKIKEIVELRGLNGKFAEELSEVHSRYGKTLSLSKNNWRAYQTMLEVAKSLRQALELQSKSMTELLEQHGMFMWSGGRTNGGEHNDGCSED